MVLLKLEKNIEVFGEYAYTAITTNQRATAIGSVKKGISSHLMKTNYSTENYSFFNTGG